MASRIFRALFSILRSPAFKYAVGLLVVLAVGRHVMRVWAQIPTGRYDLAASPWSYAGSVVTYIAGLTVFGLYYGRVLDLSATPVPYRVALRAYLISHLGKYVPGKALVVVMRAGLSAVGGVSPASAAFATLYETLVMMSVGGILAAVGFGARPAQPFYALLAFGLGIAFFVLVTPPIFPRVCRVAKTPFRGVGPEVIPRVSWRLVLEGLLSATVGWVMLGASLVWIIEGAGGVEVPVSAWPTIVASVAFATVSGFAIAVLPGGLGIREGIMIVTLTPIVGAGLATISALLLRLAWVAGEILASLALLPLKSPGCRERPCSAP